MSNIKVLFLLSGIPPVLMFEINKPSQSTMYFKSIFLRNLELYLFIFFSITGNFVWRFCWFVLLQAILLSTPILNPPQSGILGLHNIVKRPVVVEDEIVIRPVMYVALTYDHRIIDGKQAVTFLVRLKQIIENPEEMIFEK